jgi:F0F1-type ATP synthase assembly protein I
LKWRDALPYIVAMIVGFGAALLIAMRGSGVQ